MDYYSKISKGYNELHKEEQLKKIKLILKEIDPNSKILDVGCGTAFYSNFFKDYTGIDCSSGMLKESSSNVKKGCAEDLPFKDKQFDFVISVTAIHNFKDYKKAFDEMLRVSKKKVIVSLLKKSSKFDEIRDYIKADKEIEEEKDLILFKICSDHI